MNERPKAVVTVKTMNESLKRAVVSDIAPTWTVRHDGMLVCPHGNLCEDDQRDGLGDCGCVSPLVEAGF